MKLGKTISVDRRVKQSDIQAIFRHQRLQPHRGRFSKLDPNQRVRISERVQDW
ncbi:hypothetical protein SLH49_20880 [Cognatiyoonia sp. IB215446]|nr:hypothetical protein [Cognatiyoonia sp. IB215446]MDX8350451.1 hypothetical protein [Cognatiyoonia sp. IB215446]